MATGALTDYRRKRNFAVSAEPDGTASGRSAPAARFVVQKHAAHRAGVHYDFRLEHGGVLLSWAVPKGPSLDPADKRMAIHVEDHPVDYASFEGTIPDGSYGAGEVELWDSGTWSPLIDPDRGMQEGELKFTLDGQRLHGRFVLVRIRNKGKSKQDAWLLIKEHDDAERPGANAAALEGDAPRRVAKRIDAAPAPGARRGAIPAGQRPQLCTLADAAPAESGWFSEIKFDGYRMLARLEAGRVRLLTRNGLDWTERLPAIARAVAAIKTESAVLDGELVALDRAGVSSFASLQAALAEGRDAALYYYAFDLLAYDGWDLRGCALADRKRLLEALHKWAGRLRYSEHHEGDADALQSQACRMHLEGIVSKRADAPYRAGRHASWVKVKCVKRQEFVILGWTPPAGHRQGLGALHLGVHEENGTLAYVGGVGTGFSDRVLESLRERLDAIAGTRPRSLHYEGEPPERSIRWVSPSLVAEIRFAGWSGDGRLRHAVFEGLREDKPAAEVVREAPVRLEAPSAKPPVREAASRIVTARAPRRKSAVIDGIEITHPDRDLWPGVTKRQLAEYWQAVSAIALPGIARRPLSILRCPEGIAGEHFFQKHGHGHVPVSLREGTVSGQPYLAIDDESGLIGCAQIAAIELHVWGAAEDDALHPDRIVFDLDPGEGVDMAALVEAAFEVRRRLEALGLAAFCRTSGGKGLHVVSPLTPRAGWDETRAFCRAFAEAMADDAPERFVAHVKIADRRGKILVDWLRNGLGSTAVASFSPRAREGATVATPLAWEEVTPKLDARAHTIGTVPARLAKQKRDPWAAFVPSAHALPSLAKAEPKREPAGSSGGARIVTARRPARKR